MKKHPLILLLLSLIPIFAILLLGPNVTTIFLFLIHSLLCLICGLGFKRYLKLFLLVVLFSLSLFVLNFLYSTLNMAFYNFFRAILLTFVSVSASFIVDFEWLLLFMMSKKVLSPTKGYPIFAAINAIEHLKEEKKRLDHLAKMRGLTGFRHQFRLILPLLVFAVRHSQRSATAMIARGLNDDKNFYYDYSIKVADWYFAAFFLGLQLGVFFWHLSTIF